MTEQNSRPVRYSSLRDYATVLRRYWWVILIITAIGAGAGAANALRQKPIYQAQVEVEFQDPTQDLNLVQLGTNSSVTPAQVAALNQTTVTTPTVIGPVKRQLKTPLTIKTLSSAIVTSVNVGSALLQITANASTSQFAARFANAIASTLVAQDNRQTRAQFAQVASNLRKKLARLKPLPGGALTPEQSFYEDELARLDTLASFATSAQVASRAQPPAAPSSPHKARDAVIGALLGLLLGVIAAFVRDSMDRRLRKPADFESAFALPVIGNVRKQSLGKVAYATNGAAKLDQLDLEAFRILRRNVEFLDPEQAPTIVLVTSAIAEEGKTTVAGSLAFVLAAAGKRTLLVDCDLRRPDLAGRVGVGVSPGLSEYLAGRASTEEILRTVEFSESSPAGSRESKNGADSSKAGADASKEPDSPKGPDGRALGSLVHELTCIPAGAVTTRGSELLGTTRFSEFLEYASAKWDVVVLDSSPLLPVADTLEMLPHVDSIIICARQSRTTRDQARAVMASLGRFPPRPTGVVVTGIKPRGAEYEVYAYSYSYS